MTTSLDLLAKSHGIALSYVDQMGHRQHISASTKRAVLEAIGVPAVDRMTVARSLKTAPAHIDSAMRAPAGVRCYLPDWLDRGRVWGVAAQLYQLRSRRNWGIGDFEDLARLAEMAAGHGADFIGINPLHALFLAQPEHCSPFSPSNRRFLNPLYIAVDRLPGFEPGSVDGRLLRQVREAPLVDYAAVARLKLEALRAHWARWRDDPAERFASARADFAAFRAARGRALDEHALFEALSLRMRRDGYGAGWQSWPMAYRDLEGPAVTDFLASHGDEVAFQAWLQWLADSQLAQAKQRALAAGMRIGLYLDLAVGDVPDGSATWSDPTLMVIGAHIGAPPDDFNLAGQDWGLAPLSPTALRARHLAPYSDTLGDVVRHAGALRIDHAMALHHLYLVPLGRSAREGAYVRYPMADMIATLAAISNACRTLIIGEDLGTVPRGFRSIMARSEIQSYRLLYFERDDGVLREPRDYPRRALACLSTHDLPPLMGWWLEDDVRLRASLGLVAATAAKAQRSERRRDRRDLLAALTAGGLLSRRDVDQAADLDPSSAAADRLAAALHRHLASAPSRLFALRLEDLAGERDPVNLPGVGSDYPNWKPKLGVTLEDLPETARFKTILRAVAAERPRTP